MMEVRPRTASGMDMVTRNDLAFIRDTLRMPSTVRADYL